MSDRRNSLKGLRNDWEKIKCTGHSDANGWAARIDRSVMMENITVLFDQMANAISRSDIQSWIQILAAFVTAVATMALWFATRVLARETKVLARSANRAQVISTLSPNQWTLMYFDQIVENTGNAPAFDVQVNLTFEKETDWVQKHPQATWSEIVILAPGQKLTSDIGSYRDLEDQKIKFNVSWSNSPGGKKRENLEYTLNMESFRGKSRLGSNTPSHQIAEQVKKIREDWQSVATGQRRLEVNVFSEADRTEEKRERDEWYEEMKKKNRQGEQNDDEKGATK